MMGEIDREMGRAKAMATGAAILLALALSNPSAHDYKLWNQAPAATHTNFLVASLYDGHVIGIAGFFFSL
jgi:hypothetical protein